MSPTTTEQAVEGERQVVGVLKECRWAISAEYFDVVGRMDARWLWSQGAVHYFRVNWWRLRPTGFEQYIWRSAFVAVEETGGRLTVHEQTASLAA